MLHGLLSAGVNAGSLESFGGVLELAAAWALLKAEQKKELYATCAGLVRPAPGSQQ